MLMDRLHLSQKDFYPNSCFKYTVTRGLCISSQFPPPRLVQKRFLFHRIEKHLHLYNVAIDPYRKRGNKMLRNRL